MSDLTLTKTRLFEGVWEGVLRSASAGNARPEVEAVHLERQLTGLELVENRELGCWVLRLSIPVQLIADGVQTILIRDAADGETLEVVTLIAGEELSMDIRAEVDLLRAELDMLKRAFRRHCLETM